MSQVTEVPCPTPGCGRMLKVNRTTRGRPSVSCKLSYGGCGWTGFVNAAKGVALWGDGKPATPATEEKPKSEPTRKPAPSADPKPEKAGRDFRFPFED